MEPAVSFGNIDFGGGNASEMSTPGIEPQAFSQPFAPPMIEKIENPKPRKSSLDSTISMGENDMPNSRDERAIPTQVQWKEGGEKVYVTGTFCSWEKKYRLMKQYGPRISSVYPT